MNNVSFTEPLYLEMVRFSSMTGERIYEIYTSLIDYMAGLLDWTGHPLKGWKYNAEQNKMFANMTKIALECFANGIEGHGWFDIFGDIFMEFLGDKDTKGQCFTPANMCDLVASSMMKEYIKGTKSRCGSFGMRIAISEPSCGSGRLALALATQIKKKTDEDVYLVCEDIDSICVKQTAINLALHCIYGEVICHNTISEPDKVRFGYIVNEGLYPFKDGMPTLRYCEDSTRFVGTSFWASKKRKEIKQLSLFDNI